MYVSVCFLRNEVNLLYTTFIQRAPTNTKKIVMIHEKVPKSNSHNNNSKKFKKLLNIKHTRAHLHMPANE